jgi:predicted PurR-regulated permease PerM
LAWQVKGLVKDAGNMQQRAMQKIKEFQQYIQDKFGVPVAQQSSLASGKTGKEASGYVTNAVSGLVAGLGGFLTDFILFLVYTFLLMLYRSHLKEFLLRMFFKNYRTEAAIVMYRCRQVAGKYVGGLGIMIVCLCIMYTIGFSIVGVKNAFLFALLASVLETIPFIGNVTGTLLTILMTVAQGGSGGMVLGVVITYFTVQFIQTYFLETLIVGGGVNVNPLITIAGLIVGELIWGIPGMVLTIPLLGMAKIIFDNVEKLKPIGFLMGEVKS